MNSIRLAILFALIVSTAGCHRVNIEGLGAVKYSRICDSSHCGVQGSIPINLDDRDSRLLVAAPERYLGNLLNPYDAFASPIVCAGSIVRSQVDESAQIERSIDLNVRIRRNFKTNLRASLENEIASQIVSQGLSANQINVEATVNFVMRTISNTVSQVKFVVQTFTLTPEAFSDREALCRQTSSDRAQEGRPLSPDLAVIRSITIVKASAATTNSLQRELRAAIDAASGNGQLDGTLHLDTSRVVERVIQTNVTGYQFAIAMGYDGRLEPGNPLQRP